MARAAIRRILVTSGWQVAKAVLIGTQERTAAADALRLRIDLVGSASRRALRIPVRAGVVVIRLVPVRTPLPHVARHVVEAVSIWRERRDRSDSLEAVFSGVLVRELALPDVCHPFAARRQFVAPGKPL